MIPDTPPFVSAALAAAAVSVAAFLSLAWFEGSRAWPERRDETTARIATAESDVAARLSRRADGEPLRVAVVNYESSWRLEDELKRLEGRAVVFLEAVSLRDPTPGPEDVGPERQVVGSEVAETGKRPKSHGTKYTGTARLGQKSRGLEG